MSEKSRKISLYFSYRNRHFYFYFSIGLLSFFALLKPCHFTMLIHKAADVKLLSQCLTISFWFFIRNKNPTDSGPGAQLPSHTQKPVSKRTKPRSPTSLSRKGPEGAICLKNLRCADIQDDISRRKKQEIYIYFFLIKITFTG